MKEFENKRTSKSEKHQNFLQRELPNSTAKEQSMFGQLERPWVAKKVIDHLKTIKQRGPITMDDARHGMLHGTSIETVQLMIESGFICGTKNDISDQRSISVYPTNQLGDRAGVLSLQDQSIIEQLNFHPEDSINSAKIYAETIANKQAFLTKLEIPLSDAEARMNAERLIAVRKYGDKAFYSFDEAQNYFLNKNISPKEIDFAIEESLNRKGFLVGFGPEIGSPKRILDDIMLFPGDKGASDIRISCGKKGLPYAFLSGIEPLGPVEETFLKNL